MRYISLARKRAQETQDAINLLKSKPCTDCHKRYPPYVMDFDHLDARTKFAGITTMQKRRFPLRKILEEIKKCELVCANCHRERTHQRSQESVA